MLKYLLKNLMVTRSKEFLDCLEDLCNPQSTRSQTMNLPINTRLQIINLVLDITQYELKTEFLSQLFEKALSLPPGTDKLSDLQLKIAGLLDQYGALDWNGTLTEQTPQVLQAFREWLDNQPKQRSGAKPGRGA